MLVNLHHIPGLFRRCGKPADERFCPHPNIHSRLTLLLETFLQTRVVEPESESPGLPGVWVLAWSRSLSFEADTDSGPYL